MVAKEIMSKKFETVLRGFRAEDVEEFLRDVSLDFSRLQKENEDLEKKLEVLADKIREYREDEDALKDALLSAQRQGNALIADSKRKASEIIEGAQKDADEIIKQAEEGRQDLKEKGEKEIADAEIKAKEIIDDANEKARLAEEDMNRKIDNQKEILHRIINEIDDFKNRVLGSYKKHVESIEKIEQECTNDFINDTNREYTESGRSPFLKDRLKRAGADGDSAEHSHINENALPILLAEEAILKEATADLPEVANAADGEIKITDNTIKFEIDINKGYSDATVEIKPEAGADDVQEYPMFKGKNAADTNEIFFDKRKGYGKPKPVRFGNNGDNK